MMTGEAYTLPDRSCSRFMPHNGHFEMRGTLPVQLADDIPKVGTDKVDFILAN